MCYFFRIAAFRSADKSCLMNNLNTFNNNHSKNHDVTAKLGPTTMKFMRQLNFGLLILWTYSVADPGFPVGGGVDSQAGYVSKILYVKKKESGPLGGRVPGTPPSRSANDTGCEFYN